MDNQFKKKITRIIIGVIVILLLFTVIFLAINRAKKVSADTLTLSTVKYLQSELIYYFYFHNHFPDAVYVNPSSEEVCEQSLCIDYLPAGEYQYIPCRDEASEDCQIGIKKAKNYIINYEIKTNGLNVPIGINSVSWN